MAMERCVFPVPVPPTSTQLRLMLEEVAGGEITHQSLVDRRAVEHEVVDVLGKRHLGDGHLIFDRARLLFRDLGCKQITNHVFRFMLALDRSGEDLVIGCLHARRA